MSERCIVEKKNKTDKGILMPFFPVTRQIFAIAYLLKVKKYKK